MEHKAVPLRTKKVERLPPVHYCGTCKHYTENYEEPEGVWHWGEHCYAGQPYEMIRHCPYEECDKWEGRADA